MRRKGTISVSSLLLGVLAVGCGLGDNGVQPPLGRIFYPGGMLMGHPSVDPTSRWLYVVNSNSDLRYNGGTLTVVDLQAAEGDRTEPVASSWEPCRGPGALPAASEALPYCCRDVLDRGILNCDERAYVNPASTVRIGSFGGAIVEQRYADKGGTGQTRQRLFVAVRGDPSVTFIDVLPSPDSVTLRCTGRPGEGNAPSAANPRCDSEWRIRASAVDAKILLPEEPYALALDERLGILYVGHLLGGQVTALDVCLPNSQSPRLTSIHETLFAPSDDGRRGVTSLRMIEPGNAEARIYGTSRFTASVGSFRIRGAGATECVAMSEDRAGIRDLALVNAGGFASSSFFPGGADIRGVTFSEDRTRAYILHRRPGAVVFVDTRNDGAGNPIFQTSGVVEVCVGPTELQLHDSGRGPRLYVTCFEGGQIYVVDPDRPSVVAIIEVGRGPSALTFVPSDAGLGYVAGFSDNNISVIDLHPGSPTEYRVIQRLGFPSAVPR